ncbi:MAG: hypothetical protein STSR0002_11430 [Smithella sp.]|jgi:RNA polymerase sigma-70 factor (ECF subfamily)
MVSITDQNWQLEQHNNLLAGDPVASSIIADRIYPKIIKHLQFKYSKVNQDLIVSAATDAMINYLKRPEQYNPQRASLESYLKMSADGDLKNILAGEKKRASKEILSDPMLINANYDKDVVELHEGSAELLTEKAFIGQFASSSPETELVEKEQEALLAQIFNNDIDQRLGSLVINGVRETTHYADVLGINSLPIPEQRLLVKRHKDRIKKFLERSGLKK